MILYDIKMGDHVVRKNTTSAPKADMKEARNNYARELAGGDSLYDTGTTAEINAAIRAGKLPYLSKRSQA